MSLNFFSELKKHPKGLFVLFFTELWERFSYYGMRSILVLYLISEAEGNNPGLNWTNTEAIQLYGWYTALVYFSCVPGGLIADKFLGKKEAVKWGGFLLCLGHLLLAFEGLTFFYFGLSFVICGIGLLKPSISSLVGNLYKTNDGVVDQGFTVFYIGINFGALLASLVVGYIGETFGWHYGFAISGIGMILGQLVFIKGKIHIPENPIKKIKFKKNSFILSKIEIDRVKLLFVSFLIIILFWASFEQAGGLMNIYAFEKTNRIISWLDDWTVPAGWFQSINPALIILLGIPISHFWLKRKANQKESSALFKMSIGLIIMGLGFVFMFFAVKEYEIYGKSGMYWLFLAYLFHTIGELCASPVILSFITKLSPKRLISTIMGLYFAMMGFGNKMAGLIGQYSQNFGEAETFISITLFCLVFGGILILLKSHLNKLSHNAEK